MISIFPCPICEQQTHVPGCALRWAHARRFDGRRNKMRIHLIRHGETDEDAPENPKFSGPGAIPLNADGRRQVKKAAEFLRDSGFPIYYLFGSTIPRASESMDIIGETLKIKGKADDAFMDWDIGEAGGKLIADVSPFVTYFERNPDLIIPGGKQYRGFWDRVEESGAELRGMDLAGDVAVATHSRYIAATNMVLQGHYIGQTNFQLSPKPGGIVTLEQDADGNWTSKLTFGDWNGQTR